MKKWIKTALWGFIIQSSMIETALASQQTPPYSGLKEFASYWLTTQPSLVTGQNVLFNLQQTLSGIEYDATTGLFTLSPGAYAVNFFATPNTTFDNTLNLNVNGTILPTPGLEGSMVVVNFSEGDNQIAVQATGDWAPLTDGLESYFFAYASMGIYKIGTANYGKFACVYNNMGQVLTTGQNVLFQNEISLQGLSYDDTTGIITLPAGTYAVSYFSDPTNLNLVANGSVVPNSPLGGAATILNFSNETNTLALQAQSDLTLSPAPTNQCCAMITIYQIN